MDVMLKLHCDACSAAIAVTMRSEPKPTDRGNVFVVEVEAAVGQDEGGGTTKFMCLRCTIERLSLHIPEELCPGCQKPMDRLTPLGPDSSGPRDGDVTICFHCTSIAQRVDGKMQLCTLEELEAQGAPPEAIRSVRNAVEYLKRGFS